MSKALGNRIPLYPGPEPRHKGRTPVKADFPTDLPATPFGLDAIKKRILAVVGLNEDAAPQSQGLRGLVRVCGNMGTGPARNARA